MFFIWPYVLLAASIAFLYEYKSYTNICRSFLPGKPIKLEYKLIINHQTHEFDMDSKIAGQYHGSKDHGGIITIALFEQNRLATFYHELGHAATFYILDIKKSDVVNLLKYFRLINQHDYESCDDNTWTLSYTSLYGCSSFLEDIAEVYSNIMAPYIKWNSQTKAKADSICDLFQSYSIRCEFMPFYVPL
jgi:hypothetical protein